MNVFLLSKDPKLAALLLADVHVIKMILETTQLCTSVWQSRRGHMPRVMKQYFSEHPPTEQQLKMTKNYAKPKKLGKGHMNHPCAIWARHKASHYMWLCRYGLALCKRKREIYPDRPPHCCEIHLQLLYTAGFPGGYVPELPKENIATEGMHPDFDYVALAGPTKYKNAVKAYRYYYAKKFAESMLPKDEREFKMNMLYNKQRAIPRYLVKHVQRLITKKARYAKIEDDFKSLPVIYAVI